MHYRTTNFSKYNIALRTGSTTTHVSTRSHHAISMRISKRWKEYFLPKTSISPKKCWIWKWWSHGRWNTLSLKWRLSGFDKMWRCGIYRRVFNVTHIFFEYLLNKSNYKVTSLTESKCVVCSRWAGPYLRLIFKCLGDTFRIVLTFVEIEMKVLRNGMVPAQSTGNYSEWRSTIALQAPFSANRLPYLQCALSLASETSL